MVEVTFPFKHLTIDLTINLFVDVSIDVAVDKVGGKTLLPLITKKQRDILNTCGLSTDDLPVCLDTISV